MLPASIPARIRRWIDASGPVHPKLLTPCWCWLGRLNRNGYGRCWCELTKREPVVHRLVYTRLTGPIGPGLILDHLCRNHACCNPGHLEPVTHQVNTLRGNAVLFQAPPQGKPHVGPY